MNPRNWLQVFLAAAVAGTAAFSLPRTARPQAGNPAARGLERPRDDDGVLRINNLSPELEQILKNWEQATSRIESLRGSHGRFVYDYVFEVEKRARGVFYYEAPDKGRIDIEQIDDIKPGAVGAKKGAAGTPFKLVADRPERWICDGRTILQINDAEKTVEKFPIPAHAQGQNIMDGPLPFLFGMPAAKAKLRYQLELVEESDASVRLRIKPRWQQDAANWKEAQIILEKRNYLPRAVQLIDPSGNLETVYTFANLKVNQKELPLPWSGKWYAPDLRGYKMVEPGQRAPDLIGKDWQSVKQSLEEAGYKVTLLRGKPAPSEDLVFKVAAQDPEPGAPLERGQTITLTLHDRVVPRSAQQPRP